MARTSLSDGGLVRRSKTGPVPLAPRSPLAPLALLGIGLGLVAIYQAGAWLTGLYSEGTVIRGALAVAYLLAGAVAWRRRPDYLTGRLLLLAGLLVLVPTLQRLNSVGAAYALGSAFVAMHEAVLAFAILTYPSGRAAPDLNGRVARFILLVAVVAGLADLLTRQTADAQCPATVCTAEPNPFLVIDLGTVAADASVLLMGLLAVLVLVLVVRRFVLAAGAARRALAPMLLAGILAAALVALRVLTFNFDFGLAIDLVSGIAQLLIPLALGVGFVRTRMARAGVADLVLHAGLTPTLEGLEAAVRRTLHDPTVHIGRWSDTAGAYLDSHGAELDVEPIGARQATFIAGSRGRLAAFTHDPILAEEGDLLPSVSAAVRIVLENEDLATSLHAQVADARRLPLGRVTLLSTDVEGSTELLDRLAGDYAAVISDMRQIIRARVRNAGGTEIDSRADEFFGVIPDARSAVEAAVQIQREIAIHRWPRGVDVRLRIGLHTGEPALTDDGYVGMDVHLAARVAASGHGGQIVVSEAAAAAVADSLPSQLRLHDLGRYRLKGIPHDVRLYQLIAPGITAAFPALRAASEA